MMHLDIGATILVSGMFTVVPLAMAGNWILDRIIGKGK